MFHGYHSLDANVQGSRSVLEAQIIGYFRL